MAIWSKLYVLCEISSDTIPLNIRFGEKNSFEPKIFQLSNIQKTSQSLTEVYNYQQTQSLPIFGTVPRIHSKYSRHMQLVPLLHSLLQ